MKAGSVLLVVGLLSVVALCASRHVPSDGTVLATALMAVVLAGPMVAMWPYDVHERGMLGDGGANAVGAMLGYAIFAGLAPAAANGRGAAQTVLGLIAALLLLFNGLSERVSYSEFIERHATLRWLDGLGRPSFDVDDKPGEDGRSG